MSWPLSSFQSFRKRRNIYIPFLGWGGDYWS